MIKLHPNERVFFEIRKHWFVMFPPSIYFFLLAVFPPIIAFMIDYSSFSLNIMINGVEHTSALLFLLYLVWLLILWIGFFAHWTDYYLDVWFVTNERIIDVEQKGFFHREISSIQFGNIQDVSIEIKGLLGTLLDFGSLRVQTAGESSGSFILNHAHSPEHYKQLILEKKSAH